MFTYWRSWDLYAGLPQNLGGLQLFKEELAAAVDGMHDTTVRPGETWAFSAGLHLYDHSIENARAVLGMK